jgi:tetratricopeptide (TPR) repeat protein
MTLKVNLQALAALALAGVLLGASAPGEQPAPPPPDALDHARQMRERELHTRFGQATALLQARQYEPAQAALERVLALAPRLPEAHVNMGFALLELQRAEAARHHFDTAISLRPQQANAYYGLAMALEQGGDVEAALGAMRSYLHLSRADDRHRPRARAALWEWEQRLGRHAPKSVVKR